MQLKIQRSQRMGGVIANNVIFALDVRADYSSEERHNIDRYKLGGQAVYTSRAAQKHFANMDSHLSRVDNPSAKEKLAGLGRGAISLALAKMQLNISISSLGRGHHIECKDLEELLEAEETVRESCKNLTRYLEAAATFDGSETVIEYERGEERVHVTQSAPPLLTYSGSENAPAIAVVDDGRGTADYQDPIYRAGQAVSAFLSNPQQRRLAFYGVGLLFVILMVRSCV